MSNQTPGQKRFYSSNILDRFFKEISEIFELPAKERFFKRVKRRNTVDELNTVAVLRDGDEHNIMSKTEAMAIIEKLLEFYNNITNEDIQLLNITATEEIEHAESSSPATTSMIYAGYVYLLKSENGLYKIGRTKNVESRVKSLMTMPVSIELVTVIETDDMFTLEANLHKTYHLNRVTGEWFNLTDKDVEAIKGLVVKNG